MNNSTLDQLLKNIPNPIWQKISQIDELKGQWIGGAKLNPQVLGRLKKSVLVTSTGASTRIEGARLSDQDIEKLMRGISIQRFADRDKHEVQGYYELLANVFNSWNSLHFSENLIKHFHKELLKYVEKDQLHRGEYKKQENKVQMIDEAGQSVGILFDTTPVYLTPTAMAELTQRTQQVLKNPKYHPLLVIADFIVQFLQVHPFQDGNGRLSRILTNLLLLQAGYVYMPYVSHEKIIEDNKPDYYLALRKSQKTLKTDRPTIVPWLEFFLAVVLDQSKQAINLLSSKNLEKLLSPTQFKVWEYLQQVGESTPMQLSEKLSVPRPTINQVADKLLELKKIERLGQGRAVRYKVI
ncbi:MAG: Fic family protein [Candidatus Pacebacteria bacterium CG_4_10_14_0_8_um_filter_43_12]|nr:MAG: Fic family protein [Candidatus Pacebacteria bacterium CG10_big_fil_rev_8_21_14_0_10_44_11]PIY79634.1 MAG: Fic family protein [Candidatus Pacebacteria bacterium CG_4_10_14_0_8_um_filter_43_12]